MQLNGITWAIEEMERGIWISLPKCQPFKWLDFYFLFALVSVNFRGFCWCGEEDLGMCSAWLLIFDFVSAGCLLFDFGGGEKEQENNSLPFKKNFCMNMACCDSCRCFPFVRL